MMETIHPNVVRYKYSEKIKERRRSLFPSQTYRHNSSENSDLDEILPLDPSDTECDDLELENEVHPSISSKTDHLLSTPKSRNYPPSEVSMSPLYLSPYNINAKAELISLISPTKCLKTPNDCNSHSAILPKLSKKSLFEQGVSPSDQKHVESSLLHSKCSKVRTSLFPEFDIAPKHFYPSVKSIRPPTSDKPAISRRSFKMNRKSNKNYKNKKKNDGQINAGVQHKIKKPKGSKPSLAMKMAAASVPNIKSSKLDNAANSEFNGVMKCLEEWNNSKRVKLINVPNNPSRDEASQVSLKRFHDVDDNDNISKKQKLESNSASLPLSIEGFPDSSHRSSEIAMVENIDRIIDMLDESVEQNKENNKTQTTLVDTNSLLSPTSQMCNMASVMKIVSPTKVKNLNSTFENLANEEQSQATSEKASQYFPIFYPNQQVKVTPDKSYKKSGNSVKKKKVSLDQMLLDAGQKRFGLTQCGTCHFAYHQGDPSDEKLHDNHHNARNILHFAGWKNEHILEEAASGGTRIIQILPSDPKTWVAKAKEVIEVINRDMGYFDMPWDISTSKVLLCITKKTIIGCLVVESKKKGYKMLNCALDIDLCSKEEYDISCGVLRLWVSPNFRKRGVATKLMEVMRKNFVTGRVLAKSEIAVSSPTVEGKQFAVKYFGTPNFLTYLF